MGLYLSVCDGAEEVDSVELGSAADFALLLATITARLEQGAADSRFPVLLRRADGAGAWTPAEAELLALELRTIEAELRALPPIPFATEWKRAVACLLDIAPKDLAECFFDVDGAPLLQRLQGLCRSAIRRGLPIVFQ